MTIEVACPACGETVSVPDDVADELVRCNSCGTEFAVAAPENPRAKVILDERARDEEWARNAKANLLVPFKFVAGAINNWRTKRAEARGADPSKLNECPVCGASWFKDSCRCRICNWDVIQGKHVAPHPVQPNSPPVFQPWHRPVMPARKSTEGGDDHAWRNIKAIGCFMGFCGLLILFGIIGSANQRNSAKGKGEIGASVDRDKTSLAKPAMEDNASSGNEGTVKQFAKNLAPEIAWDLSITEVQAAQLVEGLVKIHGLERADIILSELRVVARISDPGIGPALFSDNEGFKLHVTVRDMRGDYDQQKRRAILAARAALQKNRE